MLINDIMTECTAECTEETSLPKVYDLIQRSEKGFVVVLDSSAHRVPIGVVNEHSICQQLVARGRNPKDLQAGNVMNSRIRRVSENMKVEACSGLVESAGDEPILVTNDKGEFTGVLERGRLAAALCSGKKESANADAEFSSLIPMKTPAKVEIPAFGWLR